MIDNNGTDTPKASKSFFKLHVLPPLLALLIVVSGGGIMFAVMNIGFSFQNRVITHDVPDGGMIYSVRSKESLDNMYPWSWFNGEKSVPASEEEYYSLKYIEAEVALIARYFLGRPYEMDCTVDWSDARCDAFTHAVLHKDQEEESIVRCVDRCRVTFDSDGASFDVRFAFLDYFDLIYFEVNRTDTDGKREFTVDEVNEAYRLVMSSCKSVEGNSILLYNLLYNENIQYSFNDSYVILENAYEASDIWISYFEYQPIEYFLCAYTLAGANRKIPPDNTKSTISYFLSNHEPTASYYDGSIYITWNDTTGVELTLRYSIADKCITGMAVKEA